MSVIRTLILSLKANAGKFDKPIKRSQKITQSFTKSLGAMALKIGAAVGAAILARKAFSALGDSFARLDKLAKTSARLGINAAQLKGLQFAGERAGFGIEVLNKALVMMVRNVGDAAQGIGEASAALKELGVDAQTLNALAPDRTFLKIGEAMKKVRVNQDRLRLTADIFGGRGTMVLNLLTQTTDEIEKQISLGAELFGIHGDSLKTIEQTNDAITQMTAAWEGLINKLSGGLGKHLGPFLDQLNEGLQSLPRSIASRGLREMSARQSELEKNISRQRFGDELVTQKRLREMFLANEESRKRAQQLLNNLGAGKSGIPKNIGFAALSSPEAVSETRQLLGGLIIEKSRIKQIMNFRQELVDRFAPLRTLRKSTEARKALDDKAEQQRLDALKRFPKGPGVDTKTAEVSKGMLRLAEAVARARGVFEATRTPLENFRAKMFEITNLLGSGLINRDTFNRAERQARAAIPQFAKADAFQKAVADTKRLIASNPAAAAVHAALSQPIGRQQRGDPRGPRGPVAALERGSQAALSEINRLKAAAEDPQKKAVNELMGLLRQARVQERQMDDLIDQKQPKIAVF